MLFCVSARSSASQKLFLPVRMGGVSVFQLGSPLSPRTGESKVDRYLPSRPRLLTIGGLYDPRPVDPALDPR